jgi:cytochrome c oxidase cbb3-type subunit III
MNSRYFTASFWLTSVAVVAALFLCGCGDALGGPGKDPEAVPPEGVLDFTTLFNQNCAGCHGTEGKGAAAIPLHNPVYLAIASDDVIRQVASRGVPGTPMAPFAKSAGGELTDKQIDVIVSGIRSWAQPDQFIGVSIPPYKWDTRGNPQSGATVYATFCASCHGANGEGSPKASSIVDGSYLALVSDQNLRTIVIAGWPSINAPDWRNDRPDRPLSPQQISDVVAWLVAQRPQFPGQPYPSSPGGNSESSR